MYQDNGQPRRILYLTPDLFGPPSGIARYCRMVCRALLQSGHSLTVLSLLDTPKAQTEAKAVFPALRYFPCSGNRKVFIAKALRAITTRPEVILVGHPNFAPLGWLLSKLLRAKRISFIYGIDAWEPLSALKRRTLSSSNRLISISKFTARRAMEVNGLPLEKVDILHNCLDPKFQPRETLASLNAAPSLLTVARINASEVYKGHDIVIRSLPALLKRFPVLVYNIVGDGDGRNILETLAAEQGVANAVRFYGVVSEEKLIEHYQNATVFVMPSRFEGFGFVFLEAMTYGKPVVCGNEDASVEVVRDGQTGFTVCPTSPEAVAEAIVRMLEDPAGCARMGESARRRVEEKFSFSEFQARLDKILAGVMEPKS